jgi:preprotein translocase subunit SecY
MKKLLSVIIAIIFILSSLTILIGAYSTSLVSPDNPVAFYMTLFFISLLTGGFCAILVCEKMSEE